MKPIGVGNPDVEVNLNETGVADLNTFVKMPDNLHFDPDAEVKTVDDEVRRKPYGQILVRRFCFEANVLN